MEARLLQGSVADVETDALVVVCFDKDSPGGGIEGASAAVNDATGGWIGDLYASREFIGKALDTAILYRPAGLRAKRVLVVGGGRHAKFGSADLRRVAGTALRTLKAKNARSIALALDKSFAGRDFVAAAAEGAFLGDFESDQYKTMGKEDRAPVDWFGLVVPGQTPELEEVVRVARIIGEGQNSTRELVNEPANVLTPTVLAERARKMADEVGLECEVLDQDRMKQLGMGALLGVAQGSAEPPALIILRYRPEGKAANHAHLGLVGKGVTFDTGGVSIKPADGMEKMKYDMAGGAAVIGSMRALAQLKPPLPVTAFIPAVENMVGGRAQRPGDIVTTLSGKTVEVLNTDAEGRLILIDALTYAKRLGCTHLVDAATLTGAIVVALGYVNVGVFSNNDAFQAKLLESAKAAGEKMWPMPVDDDYKDLLKSAFADIPNIGGRWGGAISAALFLKEFVDDTPWVHLDIAGTAWLDEGKPFLAKGPSGVGVRTFVDLAMKWKD